MGVLDKLMFWKTDDRATDVIEPVDGYTVDGCFTLPEEQQSVDMDQMRADIKADIQTGAADAAEDVVGDS